MSKHKHFLGILPIHNARSARNMHLEHTTRRSGSRHYRLGLMQGRLVSKLQVQQMEFNRNRPPKCMSSQLWVAQLRKPDLDHHLCSRSSSLLISWLQLRLCWVLRCTPGWPGGGPNMRHERWGWPWHCLVMCCERIPRLQRVINMLAGIGSELQ